ncbi:MAG: methyltransferase domain-containing protein, partial [Candidatus Binatia bacterium]
MASIAIEALAVERLKMGVAPERRWWYACLACPQCGSGGIDILEDAVSCSRCAARYPTQYGKVAFCEVMSPVDPRRQEMAPKHTWTNWRHLNYQWYAAELSSCSRDSRLIDIGSGMGWFRDLSMGLESLAMDIYPFTYVDVLADIDRRLPLIDDCADVVMLSNTLEHVYRPAGLLREIRRILKPGGR